MNAINRGAATAYGRNIAQYYTPHSTVNYRALLSIPHQDRIPSLVRHYGTAKIEAVIIILLTRFVTRFNVVRNMSAEQVVYCAAAIVESAEEDYLSVEDLAVFFDGAAKGKYGRVLDHIDQALIFEFMEVYRQERHVAILRVREEQTAQYRAMESKEVPKYAKDLYREIMSKEELAEQIEMIKKEYGTK